MSNLLIPRPDLDFMLFEWLKIEEVSELPRATAAAVLDLGERLAAQVFLPLNRQADTAEPYLDAGQVRVLPAIKAALSQYAEVGLFGLTFDEPLGGAGVPAVIGIAVLAQISAASIAAAAYPMLTAANARLIARFGTREQIDCFARPQVEGRWFGTMCLSEPQAGSSLADLSTRAIADGEDVLGRRYRLTGSKMWISGGDQDASQNIVHLVLAKAPLANGSLPEGNAGISLFIVPKLLPDGRPNDVAVAGLNHKMGYRGISNCLLAFGDAGGATGWLVGKEGDGLRQMFAMMNEARIAVGAGAAALAMRGYRLSARYANERRQGRPIGQRGGLTAPIIEHADVRRMLLQQKTYAEGALALCLFGASLIDRAEGGDEEAEAVLGLLTPVIKTWPSEFGLIANDLAIQVHGGYGYTRDFAVEQLWRDNRLNPIHEGTTGIQAIDLLGRKILRADGQGLALLGQWFSATAERAREHFPLWAHELDGAWANTRAVIARLREKEAAAFNDATLFLRVFGHLTVAWLWLDMAVAAQKSGQGAFREGKLRAARFFFEVELPQALCWLRVVDACSDVASGAPPEIFE